MVLDFVFSAQSIRSGDRTGVSLIYFFMSGGGGGNRGVTAGTGAGTF